MGNDWLDVVNEDDVVIGRHTSDDVHEGFMLHRFVQVMVIGSDGRCLLQQRLRTKKRGPLLIDASVGGHVASGETYEEAVLREAREDLGLEVPMTFLCDLRDYSPPVENMIGKLYVAHTDGPYRGWETEAERLFWLWPDELVSATDTMPFLFTGPMPTVAWKIRSYLRGQFSALLSARTITGA